MFLCNPTPKMNWKDIYIEREREREREKERDRKCYCRIIVAAYYIS